jgi:hypothetical protein
MADIECPPGAARIGLSTAKRDQPNRNSGTSPTVSPRALSWEEQRIVVPEDGEVGERVTLPADSLEALLATLRSRLPPELSARDLDRWTSRNRPLLLSRVRASLGRARPLLREEYGFLGAPRPGERGYRPPVASSGGAELLHRARALLGEAEFAWAWLAAEGPGEPDPDGEQDLLELLEVPELDAEGHLLSHAARLRLGLWVTDLAMLTLPSAKPVSAGPAARTTSASPAPLSPYPPGSRRRWPRKPSSRQADCASSTCGSRRPVP